MCMTTIEALKALYAAFGGNSATVAGMQTDADIIYALSQIVSSTAAELPAVTADNNGQVLTVVNAKWAAAALPASTD